MPSNSPDGLRQSLLELDHAPASHSAQPVKDSRKKTRDTSGQSSLPSSAPVGTTASRGLTQSLASRLQARLGTAGSTEYQQTWSQKVTPAGRPYWAHTASARRTSDKGCTGWPTPDTCAGGTGPSQAGRHAMRLQDAVIGWTTPNARDYKDSASSEALIRAMDSEKGSANLPRQVATISGWATPNANNMNDGEGLETWDARQIKNKAKHGNGNGAGMPIAIQVQTITGWPSPMHLDGWATPTANKLTPQSRDNRCLARDCFDAGMPPDSSPAETGKPAAFQLNPHFSRWLMGFPPEWCDCAVTAMQSFLSVRKPSLRRSSKP